MGGRRIPEFNHHHILFPERIWKRILGDSPEFRGVFVAKMRSTHHTRLHRELDGMLKEELTEFDFPKTSTLHEIILDYNLQKERFMLMGIQQKIGWLLTELDPSEPRNQLLIAMLKKQNEFLRYYKVQ